jgi:hypothetical protein
MKTRRTGLGRYDSASNSSCAFGHSGWSESAQRCRLRLPLIAQLTPHAWAGTFGANASA